MITHAMGLKVGGTVTKDEKSKWVSNLVDMNSNTFVLRDEPSKIVGSLFRRFWDFRVEDVSILRH